MISFRSYSMKLFNHFMFRAKKRDIQIRRRLLEKSDCMVKNLTHIEKNPHTLGRFWEDSEILGINLLHEDIWNSSDVSGNLKFSQIFECLCRTASKGWSSDNSRPKFTLVPLNRNCIIGYYLCCHSWGKIKFPDISLPVNWPQIAVCFVTKLAAGSRISKDGRRQR